MFPFCTGCAHSHPLDSDVEEQGSGGTVENHPQHPPLPASTRLIRTSHAIAVGRISATSHGEQCDSQAKEPRPANAPRPPWQLCHCRRSGVYVVFFEGLEKEANIHLYVYSFAAHCYLGKCKGERIQNVLEELRLSSLLRAIHFHMVFCCL